MCGCPSSSPQVQRTRGGSRSDPSRTVHSGCPCRRLRHVVQGRKRVHGKAAIPDAYLSVVEPQVLVGDDALGAQCEVAGYKSAVVCGADDLIGRKRFQTYEACIAEDAAHLLRSIQKQCHGLRVPDLLGHDETPAEGREVAAAPHLFLRGLRDEEIARVPQEGSLVEVTLEGPAQKARPRRGRGGSAPR